MLKYNKKYIDRKVGRGNFYFLDYNMIGISIYSDSIRAVRLKKNKKFFLKQCCLEQLYEGDLIQGKLCNPENVSQAIGKIKKRMKISDTEEVFVGLPNGLFKIENPTVSADAMSMMEFMENINFIGNKSNFSFDFPFISKNYKKERPITEDTPRDDSGKIINQYDFLKKISYVSISKNELQKYVDAFVDNNLNVVVMEPNALSYIRYLRYDATQPFMIVDIEYDYTSFVIFSERYGAFMLNASDLGSKYLINKDMVNGEIVNTTINNQKLLKMCDRAKLAEKFYIDNAIEKNAEIEQVIFLNNDYPYVIDALSKEFDNASLFSSQEMLPINLSEKIPTKAIDDDLYLFYSSMVIAMNNKTNAFSVDRIDREVEVNLVPEELIENSQYSLFKIKTNNLLMGITAIAGIYLLGTIGFNFSDIYKVPASQKVTSDLKAKYEDAKKQSENMKDNIVKYNTIAKNKKSTASFVDNLVANKPQSVSLTSMNMSYNNKKAIVECITSDQSAPSEFLQKLKENNEFNEAQISSTQTKNDKIAFQLVIPLKK